MSKIYGKPAFPDLHGRGGMSLRDHFAAAALTGLVATANSSGMARSFRKTADEEGMTIVALCAAIAYEHADAMLAERERDI